MKNKLKEKDNKKVKPAVYSCLMQIVSKDEKKMENNGTEVKSTDAVKCCESDRY